MKPKIEDKATITVQEALNHYCLSPRKFYATLHLPGLSFVVFYYDDAGSSFVKSLRNT